MRRPSPPVLDGISVSNRLRTFAALCLALSLAFGATRLMAVDNAWVHEWEIDGLVQSAEAETYANGCDGKVGIPFGMSPGWVRVGGSTDPHAPIVEAQGQILDPQQYIAALGSDAKDFNTKTNAFVNYTDAPQNHFARDLNIFLTLDPEYRHLLSDGSFQEGDSNERGNMEIEWERGGIPMYAFPAMGDRLHVFGTHIFDCGHGDGFLDWIPGVTDPDIYRTEIHSPFGWVVYRQTADADAIPGGKDTNSPWQWYGDGDLQGMAVTLPTTGLLNTPVQATVADVYFSSFGGDAVESVNGCEDADDPDVICENYSRRPELNGGSDIDSWKWANPILDRDYAFVVPAPPVPSGAPGDVQMIFELEDRCAEVPVDPTIPNKHDHKEALEEVEGITILGGLGTKYAKDWPIGAARCNHAPTGAVPYTVEVDRGTSGSFESWNKTERPAIRVTIRAKTGNNGLDGDGDDPQYPNNDYISFAYRVKVAWDYAPAAADRARTFRADFDTLRVYDDGDPCQLPPDDGEWIISLRVNDQTIHPVEGSAPDDIDDDTTPEPFWEEDAVDDAKCGGSGDYRSYEMGTDNAAVLSRIITALPGANIEVWDRTYDKDHGSYDDLAPVFRQFFPQPGPGGSASHSIGTTNPDIPVAHTIHFSLNDVSNPIPINGPLTVGSPQYGENADTSFRIRVKGTTPLTLSPPSGVSGFQYRVWELADPANEPGHWQYDYNDSDGLVVDLPDTGAGVYIVEWATVLGGSPNAIVSERSRMEVELDNVAPTLSLPADFSVFANSAAGATVTYEATATDNLPGPVTVVCAPPTGNVFPNGANGPRTTTVNCTATDAVTNESAGAFNVTVTSPHGYINDYALMGIEWLDAAQGDRAISGGVGVYDVSAGIPGQAGTELRLGNDGIVPTTSNIAAHSVRLGAGVKAGDVYSVTPLIAGANSVYTSRTACGPGPASLTKCAFVPLWSSLPTFVYAASAGTTPPLGANTSLPPGDYGALVLKSKAVVVLSAGSYSFTRIELGPNAKITYTSPATEVRVSGRVEFKSGAGVIQPVPGGAPHLKLYVGGADLAANKPAVDVFPGSTIGANVYVLNGTLAVGNKSTLVGAFIARRIQLGSNVTVTRDSAFVQQP